MKIVGLEGIGVKYIQHCGADITPVQAARVSTGTDAKELDQKNRGLLKFLAKNKHFTPFEMIDITFEVSCPIYIARQVHRHRTFSYNEQSGMYSVIPEIFFIPNILQKQPDKALHLPEEDLESDIAKDLLHRIEVHCLRSSELYNKLLDSKTTRNLSRLILPQNIITKFWMKGNLRNWMQYCALRDVNSAHFEHKHLASKIFKELLKMFPLCVASLARSSFTAETLLAELNIIEGED